jgi:hypothetical protein
MSIMVRRTQGYRLATVAGALAACLSANVQQVDAAPRPLPESCTSLTPVAIQAVIDAIDASLTKADSDVAAFGIAGAYASATHANQTYLRIAKDTMTTLQSWLHDNDLDSPYVTNTSAAYNVHGYVRETVGPLHHARHWATISATYHDSQDALDSVDRTSEALALIEPLAAEAALCYMSAYISRP